MLLYLIQKTERSEVDSGARVLTDQLHSGQSEVKFIKMLIKSKCQSAQ